MQFRADLLFVQLRMHFRYLRGISDHPLADILRMVVSIFPTCNLPQLHLSIQSIVNRASLRFVLQLYPVLQKRYNGSMKPIEEDTLQELVLESTNLDRRGGLRDLHPTIQRVGEENFLSILDIYHATC